jgi:CRP-like cAMP-binding protein
MKLFSQGMLGKLGARDETRKRYFSDETATDSELGNKAMESAGVGGAMRNRQYLAVRIADQQQVIANLMTVDSEQRLGKTLLQLARTLGKKDPRSIRIELKITHEELSEMVGATRPRISMFMQRFRNLGLIETNENHFLVIKEKKLTDYLARIA